MAESIANAGQYCLLWKIDISHAYQQLLIDPFDWPLMGIKWNGSLYFDRAIAFGLRQGGMACQRVTESLCHIPEKRWKSCAEPYIDNIMGVCSPRLNVAMLDYNNFVGMIGNLVLTVALHKCCEPSTLLTWIGVTFDSSRMIMFIELEKIAECREFLAPDCCSMRHLQVLLGKLVHATKLLPGARKFMGHLLALFHEHDGMDIHIDDGEKSDVSWFLKVLPLYNGVSMIHSFSTPAATLEVDSCLKGGGGYCEGYGYYAVSYPAWLLSLKWNVSSLRVFQSHCRTSSLGISLERKDYSGLVR